MWGEVSYQWRMINRLTQEEKTMKSENRMKLGKVLLSVFVCFTVYLSLAAVLLDVNLHRLLAS
jgi:hypothetical protein